MVKNLLKVMSGQSFDTLAVATIDFKKSTHQSLEIENKKIAKDIYFDLASLTKPLTLSSTKLIYPDFFKGDKNFDLLLNHTSSIPAGGRLSKETWENQILSYSIKESETLYSDFGPLRLMLELEKKANKNLKDLSSSFWDRDLLFWRDLSQDKRIPVTGFRQGKKIRGEVNDDNAFIIGRFCSHAGLFSTINGLSKSLINLNQKYDLLSHIKGQKYNQRFVEGWDTKSSDNSLAGNGCGPKTFGHLGFTGTSIWIDPEMEKGQIILTNATLNYWYQREGLNALRKSLGELLWKWI